MSDDRDFVAEMNEYIAQELEGSEDWVAAVVAAKLHARLLEADPELLMGWLGALAEHTIRRVLVHRAASQRATIRARVQSRAFGEAAAKMGAAEVLGMFTIRHCADENGTWKRAADMIGAEHLYVAEHTYERPAQTALMEAAFHRAVAKKVGKRRTSDVLSEAQYERMYQSVVKAPKGLVA